MSLDFDLTSKRIKNLKVLQSINVNVFEIVEDVSHVALYKYEAGIGAKWERVDVEGSAFITRNKEAPFYSLMILNKKGPTDFELDLTSKIKVKIQDIYIMIRCSAEVIFGLWFHNEEERNSLFQSLKRITSTDGNGNASGAFAASLLKLQAQAAARDSPSAKEPVEKLKYSEIVSGNKILNNITNSKPPCASAPVSGTNSPLANTPSNISPTSSNTVKKNLLLSALKPSVSETELKEKGNPVIVSSVNGSTKSYIIVTNNNSESSSAKPVGLSVSENNLGRLLLDGISNSKKSPIESNNDVKKVLFTDINGNNIDVGSNSNNNSATKKSISIDSVANKNGTSSDDEVVTTPGSARLLNLLKASGRTPSSSTLPSTTDSGSGSGNGSSPVGLSTSRDSPVQSVAAVNATAATVASTLTEAQRSDKLLSMIRHATTSTQAMDLLTDGDIAAKQLSHQQQPSSAKTNMSATTTVESLPLSKKSSASSDKLLSMLKTPASSHVSTPVPVTASATSVSRNNSPSVATGGASTDVSGSKENLLKNLLSVNANRSSPVTKTASATVVTPASIPTVATATAATPVSALSNEERTVNLLSSLSNTVVVKKSPELRPINSSVTTTVKPPSPSTVTSYPSANTLTVPKVVKPVTLLSPSDLLKLAV